MTDVEGNGCAMLPAPESLPIKSLEDLDKWRPEAKENVSSMSTIPLMSATPTDRRQTLICHDMAGGYLHDRFPQGSCVGDAYKFYNWQYVDSFVYFSHYFVTIPPPGWINAAHKHNVRILGTLITEWDDGLQRCKDFLASEDAYMNLVQKLTQVAKHYGFDGWLVNIENVIEEEKVPLMVDFVRQLTKSMHAVMPYSQVIWYDSVISTGKLRWQNELNENNCMFFNVCDGIFLNYGWKDESLERTQTWLTKCNRPYHAYVGVDVFGRGCRGGGGFNTIEAVQAAVDHGLSVAIFAQGWVYEKIQKKEEFTQGENKFWSLIHHLLLSHPSLTLPFSTSFCHGQGDNFFTNGEIAKPGPWTNLSLQGSQLTYTNCQFKQPGAEEDKHSRALNINKVDAFISGNSLQLSGKMTRKDPHLTFSLFDASCPLPEQLYSCFSYKAIPDPEVELYLDLKIKTPTGERVTSLGGMTGVGDVIKPLTQEEAANLLNNYLLCNGMNGWNSRHYVFDVGTGCSLLGIEARIVNTLNTDADIHILLGHFQLVDVESLNELPLVTNLHVARSRVTPTKTEEEEKEGKEKGSDRQEDEGKKLSLELQWTFPQNTADYYSIYYRPSGGLECKLVGHTHAPIYRVENLDLNQQVAMVTFKVEPMLRSGLKPKKCAEVNLDV